MSVRSFAGGQTAAAARPTRARFLILALLFVGTAINYLDRTNIAVAAPTMSKALGIDSALLGIIFSAFAWTYAAAQIPGGYLLDRFGTRLTYGLSLIIWSAFTFIQGTATSFGALLGMRLGLGLSEAPAFPTNNRVVAMWFPQRERAIATSVYTTGEFVGLAFLTPILFWLLATFGWSAIFFVTGALGIVWAIVWFALYRDPADSPFANKLELQYLEAGGAIARTEVDATGHRFEWRLVRQLLRYRQIWGICIGQFAVSSTLYFFLTWFPTYLVTERHMAMLKVGFYAALPYIAATAGVLIGGYWSDTLLRRGVSPGVARKTPVITGLLLASTIVLANFTTSDTLVIAILSFAFFAQGMSAITWTLVADIAPRELLGVTGGVFNLAGNLSGIVTPLVIGVIVSATGSFVGALAFVSAVALIGALSYIFVVGRISRIELRT